MLIHPSNSTSLPNSMLTPLQSQYLYTVVDDVVDLTKDAYLFFHFPFWYVCDSFLNSTLYKSVNLMLVQTWNQRAQVFASIHHCLVFFFFFVFQFIFIYWFHQNETRFFQSFIFSSSLVYCLLHENITWV